MRYRLSTLMIALAVGPPLLWGAYSAQVRYDEWQYRQRISELKFAPKNRIHPIGRFPELNIWHDR